MLDLTKNREERDRWRVAARFWIHNLVTAKSFQLTSFIAMPFLCTY